MRFNLPQNIKFTLDTLLQNNHKAYIVGGCVRDILSGKTPHDYDITTSALPHEIQNLFSKTIATGIKHGTITVMLENTPVEVTTFRTESGYNDGRHPESVSFVCNVKDDLARRDFTVNAMCYNEQEGLIDLFGGKKDIENKILRAVGDAEKRFCEDALRILRLFRFSATLGFKIETNTYHAAIKCAPLLKKISAERIFTELKKTALGNDVSALSPLLKTNCFADYYISNGNPERIKDLKNNDTLRIFALLYLTSTNLTKTLDSLKCSNSFKEYSTKIAHLISKPPSPDKISLKNALNYADYDVVYDFLSYLKNIMHIDITAHKTLLDEIKENNEPYKISQLDITGNDIIALGYDGKSVGKKLEFLLNQVIQNPKLNSREKLLNLICN